MGTRVKKAREVWEVVVTGGTLRVHLKPDEETLIQLSLRHSDAIGGGFETLCELTVADWRALCDIRNKIRPARPKRATP